ncbi:MAG: type II toxin-antitoxin system PemK/MazF family toxin [Clostridia bacterium]|nr:type II toxin-antitoxin system PemK/MazF family toxin [Clostridia bacterium]
MTLKRGEIFFAELNPVQGSEQGGTRPVLVVQNDVGNSHSPTTIVLPITSKLDKARLPTHVSLRPEESGLAKDSVVLAEQIRTIDKLRLQQKIAALDPATMNRIDHAIGISMGILNNDNF